jgi:hypothetical protein
LGSWNPDTPVMGIPYHLDVRILGVVFNTVQLSTTTSWRLVTQAIRRQAPDSYHRDLALHLRIQQVNIYLLAKAWHLAQIFSPPMLAVTQINPVISWYLWKGSVFRVPLSTLHRPKHKGGWQLTHLDAKCRTLLYCRLHQMCTQDLTPFGRWLLRWGFSSHCVNPPALNPRLTRFPCLQTAAIDSAYITPRCPMETAREFRRRVYNIIIALLQDVPSGRTMRVERIRNTAHWTQIWINLWQAPVDQHTTVAWFKVLHDILPTRGRLHAIHLVSDDCCPHCGMVDSLPHRLTACGEGPRQWEWARFRIAIILLTDSRWILDNWLVQPQFRFWPPQR